ncbi:MAG TPA: hypothetical protein VH020_03400 [Stellaceae bacterium]|nr:hypothetical protein [Stellaceae bacterium]
MKTKYLMTSLAIVGGVALAVPAFAQTQDQMNPGQTQTNAGQGQAQNSAPVPAANSDRDQAQSQTLRGDQNLDQSQAQNEDQDQTTGRPTRHSHAANRGRNYGEGMRAGSLGMDVAPGGGAYNHRDVASEESGRMSHPVVGERRAPSNVAQGSLSHVDQVEDSMTAKLNQQQLNGNGEMTATLPGQNQDQEPGQTPNQQ